MTLPRGNDMARTFNDVIKGFPLDQQQEVEAQAARLIADEMIPNAETIEAIMETRRGELVTVGSLDKLFRDLNADD
jgi:hypothetical protein